MCGRWRTSTLPLPCSPLCIPVYSVFPTLAVQLGAFGSIGKNSCRGSTLRDCDAVALGIRVSLQSPLATLSCGQMRRAALVWLTRGCQVRLPPLTSAALESMEHSPLPEEMIRKPSRWYPWWDFGRPTTPPIIPAIRPASLHGPFANQLTGGTHH